MRKTDGLKVLVFTALATRLHSLWTIDCLRHPDSLYQLLEPAHRIVFGYGITPWEFVYGIRSWLQPILISFIFSVGMVFGIDDIGSLISLNKAFMVLMSLLLIYVTYLLADTLYNKKTASYAMFFAVFSPILYIWAADINSHIPATLYSLLAMLFYYIGWVRGSARHLVLAGFSLGVAFMFRFDSLLFLLSITVFAFCTKRVKGYQYFMLGLCIMVVLQGVLDYVTWGSFLHSPTAFFYYNLVQGKSSTFGVEPFYYYLGVLGLHLPCLFLLPYACERRHELFYLAVNMFTFFAIYSLIPHKEIRLIIPVLPLLFIVAARGLERMGKMYGALSVYGLGAVTVAASILIATNPGWSYQCAYGAVSFVGKQPEATGVAFTMNWFKAGVYTYLHKEIPVVFVGQKELDPLLNPVQCGQPDMDYIGFQCSPMQEVLKEKRINYLLSFNQSMQYSDFKKLGRVKDVAIFRRIN